jgi:hypothetical protein
MNGNGSSSSSSSSRRRRRRRMNGSSRSDNRKNGRRKNGRKMNGRRRKVMIRGVFVYFEILARSPRVRVRSAEVCFYNIFIINLIINRLINIYLIGV